MLGNLIVLHRLISQVLPSVTQRDSGPPVMVRPQSASLNAVAVVQAGIPLTPPAQVQMFQHHCDLCM